MKRLAALSVALLLTLVMALPTAASTPVPGSGTYAFAGLVDDCILLDVSGTLEGQATVCQRGRSGTDQASFEGTIHLGDSDYDGTARIGFSKTDRFVVLGGSGGLRGLHGQGLATDDASGLAGTYSGRFHFDP